MGSLVLEHSILFQTKDAAGRPRYLVYGPYVYFIKSISETVDHDCVDVA